MSKDRKFSPVDCKPYITRLNFRVNHPPPDTFHVKRDKGLLESCLTQPTKVSEMFERGTPDVQRRMTLFPLTCQDLTRFTAKPPPKRASLEDPFAQLQPPTAYAPLHSVPVRPMQTVLAQLKNHSREYGSAWIQDDIVRMDERFFKPKAKPVAKVLKQTTALMR